MLSEGDGDPGMRQLQQGGATGPEKIADSRLIFQLDGVRAEDAGERVFATLCSTDTRRDSGRPV